jgi:alanine dehydrogenase
LRYGLTIADQGVEAAMRADKVLGKGLNTYAGQVTHPAVAESLAKEYVSVENVLA